MQSIMFISSEQRQRSTDFDQMVQSMDEIIRHPYVITHLGSVATEVMELNERTFLPNVRHGLVRPPTRSQRQHGSVAMLPVTDSEAERSLEMTDRFTHVFVTHDELPETMHSEPFGAVIQPEQLMRRILEPNNLLASQPEPKINLTPHGAKTSAPSFYAQTGIAFNLDPARRAYKMSIPIIINRQSNLQELGEISSQAVTLHEYGHALFAYRHGYVFLTIEGAASTEFSSWHMNAIALRAHGIKEGHFWESSEAVEALRVAHVDPAHPYRANADATRELLDLGAIS